jgi:hypothetical protein
MFRGSKGGRCVGLTTLPPSCADFLGIWEHQRLETLRVSNSPVQELLYLYLRWNICNSCENLDRFSKKFQMSNFMKISDEANSYVS